MTDIPCFILADLLKNNNLEHGMGLKAKRKRMEWPFDSRKVCIDEIRKHQPSAALQAYSSSIWWTIKHRMNDRNGQPLTTRMIYQLLLMYALSLTEQGKMFYLDDEYGKLTGQLQDRLEEIYGAVIEEWEYMQGFLPELQGMVEEFENK